MNNSKAKAIRKSLRLQGIDVSDVSYNVERFKKVVGKQATPDGKVAPILADVCSVQLHPECGRFAYKTSKRSY